MIKVLHYLRHLGLGGTEKTCQLFAAYTNQKEFDVHVVYEDDGPRSDLFRLMPGVLLWKIPREAAELQRVVDTVGADILHVYRSGFVEYPEPGVDIKVPHFVETNVFGHIDPNPAVDRSLFMSEWLMKYTFPFRYSERWDFVNNPVEPPYTTDVLPIADQWRDEGAVILGRCGRPDNGIYHALNTKAARLLRMQGHDVRFIVVSPPSNMVKDLEELEIPFHAIDPTVDPVELSKFYNSVDIYAHARADGETFGVNIAEAMMHAKPVVTHIAEPSFLGMGVFQSQTELVDDGATGFVCINDVGAYAQALTRLVEDQELRIRMGHKGYDKAYAEYHADVCVRKLERIYREVIG